jgi:hypothetical protein
MCDIIYFKIDYLNSLHCFFIPGLNLNLDQQLTKILLKSPVNTLLLQLKEVNNKLVGSRYLKSF